MLGLIGKIARGIAPKTFTRAVIGGGALYGAGSYIQRYGEGNYETQTARGLSYGVGGALKMAGVAKVAMGVPVGIRNSVARTRQAIRVNDTKLGISNNPAVNKLFKNIHDKAKGFTLNRSGAQLNAAGHKIYNTPGSGLLNSVAAPFKFASKAVTAPINSVREYGSLLGKTVTDKGSVGDQWIRFSERASSMKNPFMAPMLVGAAYGGYRSALDNSSPTGYERGMGLWDTAKVSMPWSDRRYLSGENPYVSSRGATGPVNVNAFKKGINHYSRGIGSPIVASSQEIVAKRMMSGRREY